MLDLGKIKGVWRVALKSLPWRRIGPDTYANDAFIEAVKSHHVTDNSR